MADGGADISTKSHKIPRHVHHYLHRLQNRPTLLNEPASFSLPVQTSSHQQIWGRVDVRGQLTAGCFTPQKQKRWVVNGSGQPKRATGMWAGRTARERGLPSVIWVWLLSNTTGGPWRHKIKMSVNKNGKFAGDEIEVGRVSVLSQSIYKHAGNALPFPWRC